MIRRIQRRATFDALRSPQRRTKSGPITVAFVASDRLGTPAPTPASPADDNSPTVGNSVEIAYSIGRRVGSAVDRNRLRRRLRVLVRKHECGLPSGAYLVTASAGSSLLAFGELDRAVEAALDGIRSPVKSPGPGPGARGDRRKDRSPDRAMGGAPAGAPGGAP